MDNIIAESENEEEDLDQQLNLNTNMKKSPNFLYGKTEKDISGI